MVDRAGRSGDTDSGYANARPVRREGGGGGSEEQNERERERDRLIRYSAEVTLPLPLPFSLTVAEPGEGNRKPPDENQEQGRANGERHARALRN